MSGNRCTPKTHSAPVDEFRHHRRIAERAATFVTAPGGAQYRGSVFSGGWSQPGGSADRVNNVENVYVQSAAAGTWSVEVAGLNVPNGPQPSALVVDGDLGVVNQPAVVAVESPANGSTVSGSVPISIAATDEDPAGTLTVEWNVGETPVAGATVSGNWGGGTSGSASCMTDGSGTCSVTQSNVARNATSVTFTVTDVSHASFDYASGENHDPDADSDGTTITVTKEGDEPPPSGDTVHIGDLDGSSTSNGNRWTATVTITVHDADDNPCRRSHGRRIVVRRGQRFRFVHDGCFRNLLGRQGRQVELLERDVHGHSGDDGGRRHLRRCGQP